jgi:hypothetical protein
MIFTFLNSTTYELFIGVFESMSYFLTHFLLTQIAQITTKHVGYFRAICK